jgi:hypothetical protein
VISRTLDRELRASWLAEYYESINIVSFDIEAPNLLIPQIIRVLFPRVSTSPSGVFGGCLGKRLGGGCVQKRRALDELLINPIVNP